MSISKIDRPFGQFIKVWCYDVRMIIEWGNVIIQIINRDKKDVWLTGKYDCSNQIGKEEPKK